MELNHHAEDLYGIYEGTANTPDLVGREFPSEIERGIEKKKQ
jgi:hypothetical protein